MIRIEINTDLHSYISLDLTYRITNIYCVKETCGSSKYLALSL